MPTPHDRFDGQVALVTGASAGIGRATAEMLAAQGASVVLVARDAARLDPVVAAIRAAGGQALAMAGDAQQPDTAARTVQSALDKWGRIDVLVNGVGGSTVIADPRVSIEMMEHVEWRRMLDFNLDPVFHFCRAVLPAMKQRRCGKIVNVGSIAGRGAGVLSGTAYVTAKAGLIGFTKKLALEVGPWNINVNSVAPAFTLSERFLPQWQAMTEEARKAFVESVPLRRVGTPQDQAGAICFLASAQAAFVTGVTLDVTGGQW